jgi:hypothetical protein
MYGSLIVEFADWAHTLLVNLECLSLIDEPSPAWSHGFSHGYNTVKNSEVIPGYIDG